jgi:hypothetical protein
MSKLQRERARLMKSLSVGLLLFASYNLERIPVMFEHSRHGERNFCILAG